MPLSDGMVPGFSRIRGDGFSANPRGWIFGESAGMDFRAPPRRENPLPMCPGFFAGCPQGVVLVPREAIKEVSFRALFSRAFFARFFRAHFRALFSRDFSRAFRALFALCLRDVLDRYSARVSAGFLHAFRITPG